MTLAILTIAVVLMCFSIFVVTKSIAHLAFEEGREAGYRQGTFDALKTSMDAEQTIIRDIEAAPSFTSFPHRK